MKTYGYDFYSANQLDKVHLKFMGLKKGLFPLGIFMTLAFCPIDGYDIAHTYDVGSQ